MNQTVAQKASDVFLEMKELHAKIGNQYRARAYDAAAYRLRRGEFAGFSRKMADKLREIAETGRLAEMRRLKELVRLSQFIGFGPAIIRKLHDCGVKSIGDLRGKKNQKTLEKSCGVLLTAKQKLGIKLAGRINTNIRREYIRKITAKMRKWLEKRGVNMREFHVVGSYRREARRSGDIDILIISEEESESVISDIYNAIVDFGEYMAYLDKGPRKFSFLLQKGRKYIQVDIRVFLPQHRPTALLYFTGSGNFNIKMRQLAKMAGFKLNEYGLFRRNGRRVAGIDAERDVFNALGADYLEPRDRV